MTKAERIRILREEKGISQVELAERIGVSKQNMYKYENDIITNIPSDKIEAMAKVLNVSPGYIMGWEDDKDKKPEISAIDTDEFIGLKKPVSIKKPKVSFGEFINNRRKELNMSIDELVEKSNVPKGTLSKITAGINTNPTLTTATALCKALECSIDDAFDFERENTVSTVELDIIKKYRKLDTHGVKIVNFVLDEEYKRCVEVQSFNDNFVTVATAARNGGEPTTETITQEQLEALRKAKPRTY